MRSALLNIVAIVAGTTLLSLAFGWQIGVGVGLMVWFLKTPEPYRP